MGFFFEAVGNSKSKTYVNAATFITDQLVGLWDPAHPKGFSPGIFHDVSGHPQSSQHEIRMYYNTGFSSNQTLQYHNGVPYINIVNSTTDVSYLQSSFGYMNGYAFGSSDAFYIVNRKNWTWDIWLMTTTGSNQQNFISSYNEAFRFRMNGGGTVEVAVISGMSSFTMSGTGVSNVRDVWENWIITMEDLGANDACRVYKNGTLVGSRLTGNYNPTNTASWGSTYMFGTYNIGNGTNGEYATNARIGLIRAYNKTLNSTEVTTNWTNTKSRFGL